jgi:hypothetical protein
MVIWYISSRLGMLYQDQSGNPALQHLIDFEKSFSQEKMPCSQL